MCLPPAASSLVLRLIRVPCVLCSFAKIKELKAAMSRQQDALAAKAAAITELEATVKALQGTCDAHQTTVRGLEERLAQVCLPGLLRTRLQMECLLRTNCCLFHSAVCAFGT